MYIQNCKISIRMYKNVVFSKFKHSVRVHIKLGIQVTKLFTFYSALYV